MGHDLEVGYPVMQEKVLYLKQYLAGEAQEAVEGYFLLSSQDGYEEAKKLLEERYGSSFIMGNAFSDKRERWPKIGPKDGIRLGKFADSLRQCAIAMDVVDSLSILTDERQNKIFPDWIISRWIRIINDWREWNSQFPPFNMFVQFVTKEHKISCVPVTSFPEPRGLEVRDRTRPKRVTSLLRQDKRTIRLNQITSLTNNPRMSQTLQRNGHALCAKLTIALQIVRALWSPCPLEHRKTFGKE